ncbi:MAG TPA: histidine kinase dimerization/phosphoacceptor domain -containing protein [Spirochaetota bacterium]|nr:histidine kinase dimerization/phosphoacceptor domain -containing protein [Spirochaetota bacterium]
MILSELINNISMILVLVLLYSFLYRLLDYNSLLFKIYSGILFGAISIVAILNSFQLEPGLVFDGRSIIISISGFFGGPIAAIVSGLMAASYRIWLGGPGMNMGIAVITEAAAAGIVYHYLRKRKPHMIQFIHLFVFGLIVHLAMLACTSFLPEGLRLTTLRSIYIPVLLIYPAATVIICILLIDQETWIQTHHELRQSEDRYRGIVENIPIMICRFLPLSGIITYVNTHYCDYFGKTKNDLIGTSFLDMIPDNEKEEIKRTFSSLNMANPVVSYEHRVEKGGETRWQHWIDQALFDHEGNLVEYQSVGQDITDARMFQENTNRALREKEILLKEIHHRVKNNMQIISSLLSLQSNYIIDEKDKKLFEDSQNRVRSMALVHEKLYKSENLSEIDFEDYINTLVQEIKYTYYELGANISISVRAHNIFISIDTAIPCALIINELLSNSLKYAFSPGEKGAIDITCSINEEGKHVLVFSDDGIGMPEGIDIKNTDTLGLKLVSSLTIQLKGEISLNAENGTEYTIVF